jgi:cysteinyl-tRNA synthetase
MRAMVLLVFLAACGSSVPQVAPPKLTAVERWAIQLQGLEDEAAIERLAAADLPLVVVDPVGSVRGTESFDDAAMVRRLRGSGRTLVLAYLNVGQAEDYRTYWRGYWRKPSAGARGEPDYLLGADPEGWPGNYTVAFWDLRWRSVLWGGGTAPLDAIARAGFDGVYLDWVLGFEDPTVAAAAEADGVDPARALAELVRDLRAYARRTRPGFLVVAQNCAGLAERVPELAGWIDGAAQEDLSFSCTAAAQWDDPAAGDVPTPPARAEHTAAQLAALGLPVFTLDYCLDPDNAARARAFSEAHGFHPFVSRGPLDRLP